MSLYEICERCDRRRDQWQVRQAHLEVGEVNRRPHLCEDCTVTVMSAVLVALRPVMRPAFAAADTSLTEAKP